MAAVGGAGEGDGEAEVVRGPRLAGPCGGLRGGLAADDLQDGVVVAAEVLRVAGRAVPVADEGGVELDDGAEARQADPQVPVLGAVEAWRETSGARERPPQGEHRRGMGAGEDEQGVGRDDRPGRRRRPDTPPTAAPA